MALVQQVAPLGRAKVAVQSVDCVTAPLPSLKASALYGAVLWKCHLMSFSNDSISMKSNKLNWLGWSCSLRPMHISKKAAEYLGHVNMARSMRMKGCVHFAKQNMHGFTCTWQFKTRSFQRCPSSILLIQQLRTVQLCMAPPKVSLLACCRHTNAYQFFKLEIEKPCISMYNNMSVISVSFSTTCTEPGETSRVFQRISSPRTPLLHHLSALSALSAWLLRHRACSGRSPCQRRASCFDQPAVWSDETAECWMGEMHETPILEILTNFASEESATQLQTSSSRCNSSMLSPSTWVCNQRTFEIFIVLIWVRTTYIDRFPYHQYNITETYVYLYVIVIPIKVHPNEDIIAVVSLLNANSWIDHISMKWCQLSLPCWNIDLYSWPTAAKHGRRSWTLSAWPQPNCLVFLANLTWDQHDWSTFGEAPQCLEVFQPCPTDSQSLRSKPSSASLGDLGDVIRLLALWTHRPLQWFCWCCSGTSSL